MFEPIRTQRLVIREVTTDDVDALLLRRNDEKVAEYQNWVLPFPREKAQAIVEGAAEMSGPENDEWWMAGVDLVDGTLVGDLAVHLSWGGRTAEIGYTFDSAHWGNGYAVEAVEALVEYLFESLDVARVFGMLHPDNRASAQVLERTGFLFEGHTRKSHWLQDEVSDDWIYGLVREDWEAWRGRPRQRPDRVELVEVTNDSLRAVYDAQTHKTQESFVAPNHKSLAQAHLRTLEPDNPDQPWYRAIEADGEIAGFVMVALPEPDAGEPFLWRLLVDRMHQRRGIAGAALELVEDHVRSVGHEVLSTSWIPGRGSPEPFYQGRGYEPTGHVEGGEIVARKTL